MQGPLTGTIVLDMSQAVTGPYAGWLLRGMGARVIKLEGLQGDQSRVATRSTEGKSPLFALYNGGKEAITLNLKTEKGREIFKELVPKFDVVIENFVPGTMDGWQLSYEVLAAVHPGLVYASISGYGRDSEYAPAPGLARAGWELADAGKAISKSFRFRGCRDAMAWIMRAAFEAEQLNHHPEWSNVYNRVEVRLTTHDAGGLTARDIDLARRMEKISTRSLAK